MQVLLLYILSCDVITGRYQ